MSVVAIDVDGATIRLIDVQTRKYQFGVIGLCCRFNTSVGGHLSASQQQHRETRQPKKGDCDSHTVSFV
jgi:hypothetical protein